MAKPDRKELMRKSIVTSQEVDRTAAQNRLKIAEKAMSAHPKGLMSPPGEAGFHVETVVASTSGNVARLPIDHVHDNPFNARHIYDPQAIKELASSIATRGQLVPAPAVPHPTLEGHYILIDGHYRKKALQHAGKNEIECVIHEPEEDLELYRRSFLINEQRNAQFPLDNAMAWRHLLDMGMVESSDAIAEMLGTTKVTVSKTLSLLKLPENALAKMREAPGKFSLGMSYELSMCTRCMDETELLALMDRIVDEDLSVRQLETIRAKREANTPRKTKETSRQYKIRRDGAVLGVIKVWDESGKVELEIKLADPKQRGDLLELLKRQFGLDENLFG